MITKCLEKTYWAAVYDRRTYRQRILGTRSKDQRHLANREIENVSPKGSLLINKFSKRFFNKAGHNKYEFHSKIRLSRWLTAALGIKFFSIKVFLQNYDDSFHISSCLFPIIRRMQ